MLLGAEPQQISQALGHGGITEQRSNRTVTAAKQ